MASKSLHCRVSECDSESSWSSSESKKNSGELTTDKRKSSTKQESVRKRHRVASEPIKEAVEIGTVLVLKRKTKSEAAAHKKRETSHSTRKPSELPVDQVLAKGLKRKASPERKASWRKKRDGNNATATTEASSLSRESFGEAGSKTEDRADQLTAKVNLEPTESKSQVSPSSTGSSTSQNYADFEAKYHQLHKLSEGGFGSVYAGMRKTDSFPVAIKHIPLSDVDDAPLVLHGQTHMTPLEVLLMVMMAGDSISEGQSAAVSLLDWYRLDQEVLLVMERPVPSVDLLDYLLEKGPMEEDTAKNIMKQLIEAAINMHSARVFHRDLKSENVLIQTVSDKLRVRLIDFGCGCIMEEKLYSSFDGTSAYAPPEFFLCGTYEAGPTTVWQLGALLYEMVDGSTQFTTVEFLRNKIAISNELTQDCQDFLKKCLDQNPKHRFTLAQMQSHPWLKEHAQQTTAN